MNIIQSKAMRNVASLVGVVVGVAMFATTAGAAYSFGTNLKQGMSGADVKALQQALNMSADTQVSMSGAGAPGMETSYFGAATKAAVVKFQNKYASEVLAPAGLTAGTGFVGALTRAKLNAMGGVVSGTTSTVPGCTSTSGFSPTTGAPCNGSTTTIPVGGGLTVSAGMQPANDLAIQGASRVAFTKLTLTAGSSDVMVNGITVQRTGAAVDGNFAGVVLLQDDGTQLDIAKTLGSTHQAIIGGNFIVKAGTSMNLTVAGNMNTGLSGNNGQIAGLDVVAVNTTGTVSGALPIMGARHTINGTLTIGTLTAANSSYDPGTTATKAIGTTGYKFTGVRLTAGSAEDVRLKSVRFYQAGSASSGDIANVAIFVDGVSYPTTVSSDGKYYSANFGSGIVISKGLSKDVWIQGDIVGSGSAGRTVDFDLQKNTDIYASGETYGQGLIYTGTVNSTASTATPAINGYAVTVSAGSFTSVMKATSVAAQNIAVNLPNQPLGGYTVDLTGEAISAQSHVFTIASTTPSGVATVTSVLTNVSLYDENGAVVAGPVDAVAVAGGSTQTVTFSDTVTYPLGKHTYTLKGKVPSGIANGAVYTTTFTTMSNITGQTTGNTIASPSLGFAMNAMTVKAASLAVSQSTSPSAQFIIAGATGVTFANIQLDASQSGEDVRLSTLSLTDTVVTAAVTNLTSCQLFDGATALNTGSNVVNPTAAAAAFTFDSTLTIAKGTVKTLTLKCNVASGITGSFTWNMTAAQITALTVTGVTSGSTVVATGGATTGATQTIGSGSLVASLSPSSPAYAIAAAGSTGVTAAVIRLRPTNDSINLNRLGLQISGGKASAADLVQVSVWNGATQVGTAVFTGTSSHATSTFSSSVLLPRDVDTDLTVKVDLAQIGSSQPGTQGAKVVIDVDTAGTNTEGTGVGSGATIDATGTTSAAGIRLFKSFPVVAADSSIGGTGVIDGKIMRFKVTANAAGGIGINQFKFTVATTSATVTLLQLYGYTDSAYSTPIANFSAGAIHTSTQNAPLGALTITPTSVIEIPAGTTYYFELRGSVTASATTYAVTTTLLGDSAYSPATNTYVAGGVGMATTSAATIAAPDASSFVWSPNATTTSAAAHVDWTNGFGVVGLPSGGLTQTRSN